MPSPAPVLSVVTPLYGEAENVAALVEATRAVLDDIGFAWELILVDDGSTDGTWDAIRREASAMPNLRAIRLSRNFGKEAALCAGLEAAAGEGIVVMDGDLQHPPALIPEMVRRWRETEADVVEAVKTRHRRDSLAGRLFHRPYYWLMKRMSGFDLRNATDFKLVSRRVREAWLRLGERNLFFRGMVAWLGFQREQIPFEVPETANRRSRFSGGGLLKLGATGLTAFSSAPLRMANLLGAFFFLFAIGLGGHSLWMKFTDRAVEGFTTVIILQLFIGSLLMFLLGIIGEYLARIYEEVKARPRYLVSESLGAEAEPPTERSRPTP